MTPDPNDFSLAHGRLHTQLYMHYTHMLAMRITLHDPHVHVNITTPMGHTPRTVRGLCSLHFPCSCHIAYTAEPGRTAHRKYITEPLP